MNPALNKYAVGAVSCVTSTQGLFVEIINCCPNWNSWPRVAWWYLVQLLGLSPSGLFLTPWKTLGLVTHCMTVPKSVQQWHYLGASSQIFDSHGCQRKILSNSHHSLCRSDCVDPDWAVPSVSSDIIQTKKLYTAVGMCAWSSVNVSAEGAGFPAGPFFWGGGDSYP